MVIPSCCQVGMGQRWNEQQFPAKMAIVQSPCIRWPEAFLETLYVFMLLLAIPLNPFVLLITFQLTLLGFLDLYSLLLATNQKSSHEFSLYHVGRHAKGSACVCLCNPQCPLWSVFTVSSTQEMDTFHELSDLPKWCSGASE